MSSGELTGSREVDPIDLPISEADVGLFDVYADSLQINSTPAIEPNGFQLTDRTTYLKDGALIFVDWLHMGLRQVDGQLMEIFPPAKRITLQEIFFDDDINGQRTYKVTSYMLMGPQKAPVVVDGFRTYKHGTNAEVLPETPVPSPERVDTKKPWFRRARQQPSTEADLAKIEEINTTFTRRHYAHIMPILAELTELDTVTDQFWQS